MIPKVGQRERRNITFRFELILLYKNFVFLQCRFFRAVPVM